MDQIALLKEFTLFNRLSDQELEKFVSRLTEKTYADGTPICKRGEPGGCLYLIKQGSVEVVLPLYRYESKSKIVSNISSGMFFGELSFWDGKECSADVYAKGEVQLLELKKTDYDDIINTDHEYGYNIQSKILLVLASRIRKMNENYSLNVYMGKYE